MECFSKDAQQKIIKNLLHLTYCDKPNLWTILKKNHLFREIHQLFESAQLVEFVKTQPALTILIPSDAVVDKLNDFIGKDTDFLREILMNHMFFGVVSTEVFYSANGEIITACGGGQYRVIFEDGEIYLSFLLEGKSHRIHIRNNNVEASNGVLHLVETFLF